MSSATVDPQAVGGDAPFPMLQPSGIKDGGQYPAAPPGYTESLGRATYHAVRLRNILFITAEGTLADLNQIADIRQLPILIYPPQFGMYVYTPRIALPATRPFKFTVHFGFPEHIGQVVIRDRDGIHHVPIKDVKEPALPFYDSKSPAAADSATNLTTVGLGASLQEALDHAVAALPTNNPKIADGFVVYTILEAGRFRGGIAGIDLHYAKVEARFGTSAP